MIGTNNSPRLLAWPNGDRHRERESVDEEQTGEGMINSVCNMLNLRYLQDIQMMSSRQLDIIKT